jgi:hypothetical protein
MSDIKKDSEVDLISFFEYLGSVFLKVVSPIIRLAKFTMHAFADFAITITKNVVLITVVAVLVSVAAGLHHYLGEKVYHSELVLKPNFGSVINLYQGIDHLNALADVKDSTEISAYLGISVADAATIQEFEVEPINDNLSKYVITSRLLQDIDSTILFALDKNEMINEMGDLSFPIHKVSVKGLDYRIFSKLTTSIVNIISNEEVFNERRLTKQKNLEFRYEMLLHEQNKLDTLQNVITQEVLAKYQLTRNNASTNINVGASSENTIQPENLFKLALDLDREIGVVRDAMQESENLVEVLFKFKNTSKDVRTNIFLYIIYAGLIAVFVCILVIYLIRIAKFFGQLAKI